MVADLLDAERSPGRIAYVDSSVLATVHLADEPGHDAALATGTLARIEASRALVRAPKVGRIDLARLLDLLMQTSPRVELSRW